MGSNGSLKSPDSIEKRLGKMGFELKNMSLALNKNTGERATYSTINSKRTAVLRDRAYKVLHTEPTLGELVTWMESRGVRSELCAGDCQSPHKTDYQSVLPAGSQSVLQGQTQGSVPTE